MRIGTRGSALALAQARKVADRIEGADLVVIDTSGDRGQAGGDKARWVDAIEHALLAGEIDLAVHSAKDVPADLAEGLELVACPPRADPRDALCTRPPGPGTHAEHPSSRATSPEEARVASSLARLPAGARVGTSSLRRTAQLRALRDDLDMVELRGNVDTRLRRLAEGDFDAIVIARAGLQRLGRDPGVALDELVPAAGQGTLALEARAGDRTVAQAVAGLRDPDTETALAAERALVGALGADCHTAMGAYARLDVPEPDAPGTGTGAARLRLHAWIGLADGSAWIADELTGDDPQALGRQVAERLLAVGAAEILGDAPTAGHGAHAGERRP